jgi:hypothetical protein
MSKHAHRWAIQETGFNHLTRVFSVYWVCTQGRCTGTRVVDSKPVRKPSKDARTDEELHERKTDRALHGCTISPEVAGWPEGTDAAFDHLFTKTTMTVS